MRSCIGPPGLLLALLLLTGAPDARPSAPSAPARVIVDGRVEPLPPASTVREALDRAGIELGADDEVEPGPDTPLPEGGLVRVRRVRYEERESEAPIPYRTLVRPAAGSNRPYHPTVLREGRKGVKRVLYRIKLSDGMEVRREVIAERVIREPVPEVVVARQPWRLGSRGAYAGKRTLTVLATAYDPSAGSCGRFADGKTANGKRAGYGIIAVDPRVIPLGAKLFVPGYGYGIAADVGRAIRGNRIDLGFNSRQGARAWGKRQVQLSIVD